MEIDHVRVIDLTPDDLVRCRELSFGDEGFMCDDLEYILDNEQGWQYRYSQSILVREGSEIIGWALLMPVPKKARYSAQLYVDPMHRRKGIGKTLLEEANRWGKSPFCFIDEENEVFFKKFPKMYQPWEEELV